MATKLEIQNIALGLLGVERMLVLNDGSKASNVMNTFYDATKLELLRSHNWNFATKRTSLSSSGTPAFEFKYQITKPTDCLRVSQFYDYKDAFKEEGNVILLNQQTVKFKYIRNDVVEADFDPSFVVCFSSKLAENACFQMIQNASKEQLLIERHNKDLAQARRNNAISNTPDDFQDPVWITSRF